MPKKYSRYSVTIRQQQDVLKKREKSIDKQRSQLKLVHDDIRGQQRELEGVYAQIKESLIAGEALLSKILGAKQSLDKERQDAEKTVADFKKARTEVVEKEQVNVKQISRWFQSMPPENAAAYLRELANDGKISSAIQLLGNISEREVAKILVAMDDPTLVVQMTEQFKGLERPDKKQRR